MSLARAFTKRMKRAEEPPSPRRANTVKYHGGPIDVRKISSPVEFLSTTNVHALTAPDIRKISGESDSSGSSTHSGNDSDFSTIDRSFLSSITDSSSPSTPITPPMDNDIKGFFETATPTKANPEAPKIPQRAPSHSKKAHVELSRKRSIQRMSPPPTSLTRAASVRDTTHMFSSRVQESITEASESPVDVRHPFGAELAKVNEVAEGFGAGAVLLDEEEQYMFNNGLQKFGVQDYINEIAGLYGGIFEDKLAINPWI